MPEKEKEKWSDSLSSDGDLVSSSLATRSLTDENIAQKLHVVDQLTTLYGFDPLLAEQAVEAVGLDAQACCDYLLDNNLASDQGGPIVPINDCPHLAIKIATDKLPLRPQETACSHIQIGRGTGKLKATMSDDGYSCPSTAENWICLECGVIRCGRYVNAHAKAHHEVSGHHTAISLADLSVWCYQCQAYIINRENQTLVALLNELEKRKFQHDL